MFLSLDERLSMTRFGSRYVLNIRNVMEEDYGNYTCKAQNNLGTASTYIILTGTNYEQLALNLASGITSEKNFAGTFTFLKPFN